MVVVIPMKVNALLRKAHLGKSRRTISFLILLVIVDNVREILFLYLQMEIKSIFGMR